MPLVGRGPSGASARRSSWSAHDHRPWHLAARHAGRRARGVRPRQLVGGSEPRSSLGVVERHRPVEARHSRPRNDTVVTRNCSAWPTSQLATVQPRAGANDVSSDATPSSLPRLADDGGRGIVRRASENRHVSPASVSPVSAIASARAFGSHCAYAVGAPLRCTCCAATVIGSVAHPSTRVERTVERGRRVARRQDLGRGAPALRRPLLEQAERVAIAVRKVVQLAIPATRPPARR